MPRGETLATESWRLMVVLPTGRKHDIHQPDERAAREQYRSLQLREREAVELQVRRAGESRYEMVDRRFDRRPVPGALPAAALLSDFGDGFVSVDLFGWAVGEHDTLCAVVRREGQRMLSLVHHSRVDVEAPAWALEAER